MGPALHLLERVPGSLAIAHGRGLDQADQQILFGLLIPLAVAGDRD